MFLSYVRVERPISKSFEDHEAINDVNNLIEKWREEGKHEFADELSDRIYNDDFADNRGAADFSHNVKAFETLYFKPKDCKFYKNSNDAQGWLSLMNGSLPEMIGSPYTYGEITNLSAGQELPNPSVIESYGVAPIGLPFRIDSDVPNDRVYFLDVNKLKDRFRFEPLRAMSPRVIYDRKLIDLDELSGKPGISRPRTTIDVIREFEEKKASETSSKGASVIVAQDKDKSFTIMCLTCNHPMSMHQSKTSFNSGCWNCMDEEWEGKIEKSKICRVYNIYK
jgi:hypothetical protein